MTVPTTLATPSSSTPVLIHELQHLRNASVDDPHRVVTLATALIERGYAKRNDDDVWAFLEQAAQAALQCGQVSLAQVCVQRLSSQFPNSNRVAALQGMLYEAQAETHKAWAHYREWLTRDEADVMMRKRLIAIHLSSNELSSPPVSKADSSPSEPNREHGLRMLVEYLETYYQDPEAWSMAARTYAEMGSYAQSLTALSHLILLATHNPFHLLHHAETAYTLGQYDLAFKEFLRVIEMSDGMQGAGRRAGTGARLCIERLRSITTASSDPLLKPQRIDELERMLTRLLMEGSAKGAQKEVWGKWLGGTQEKRG
ncbi:BQ5605_C007g04893 [Microbotryum silenes-dioicae]|uniref:ER membrane protein complex subunit 2 n=1 Tax=Microbotryum silenes-dioicae TaxID=796604 RepID=A0A2X0PAC0_9BASI|nr:BQ5605_C007g04893 [Microbotryum silenes-dioicae]